MIKNVISNKQNKQKSLFEKYKKNYSILLMLLPGVVALILFCYVPMFGILIAFKDYKFAKGIIGSDWVGMQHFVELFSQQNFGGVIYNTVYISFFKLIFGFPTPIILALLLNELRLQKLKNVIQTCTYLPHFFSWVVLAGIFKMFFSNVGPVNSLLSMIGINGHMDFYGDGGLFRGLVIGTAVWQSAGWGAIIYLAALSGVDESLYEAAYLDGAGRLKQAWHISIPCIVPTIITVFILNLGNILNAGYDQIYNMYNPTVYAVSDIVDTYVMRALKSMNYGAGTAAELFKSIISFAMVIISNKIVNKISDNELGIM